MTGDGLLSDATYAIELSEVERRLLGQHFQWLGPARCSDATAAVIGYDTAADLQSDIKRLLALIRGNEPMTPRDWRRALISCEILFGSDVLGCGVEWHTVTGVRDEESVTALRTLQRRLGGVVRGRP